MEISITQRKTKIATIFDIFADKRPSKVFKRYIEDIFLW